MFFSLFYTPLRRDLAVVLFVKMVILLLASLFIFGGHSPLGVDQVENHLVGPSTSDPRR